MKILVLSSHTPSLFWFRMDMMRTFISKGAEVIAVANESTNIWSDKFAKEGIKYLSIPVSRNGLNIIGDIKTYIALKKIIRDFHPHKIFTYQAKTIVYGILAAHQVDKSIQNYPLVAGLGSIFRGKGLKNQLVKIVLSKQYKLAFHFSKSVIFQNTDDKNEFISLGLLNANKAVIINGSGVSLEKFIKQPLPSQKTILYVGRLIRDKGIGEYLKLAENLHKSCNDVQCLLVGPYDSNPTAIKPEELKPYIDNGIVKYFGEQSDIRPFLNQCMVFVLPSYHEGTPKTVLEALACGRPVVTTDAPGCRETVVDGENGFLVPVKDVKSLEIAVLKILDDIELAQRFAKKARAIAENKYDVNKVNASIMKIMEL